MSADCNSRSPKTVSFIMNCETQEEIDSYWERLTADGRKVIQMKKLDLAKLEKAFARK
jgi:predicted 3-demethylubiquinone-9 3-methyltransferase (glyoxalase superfamily)